MPLPSRRLLLMSVLAAGPIGRATALPPAIASAMAPVPNQASGAAPGAAAPDDAASRLAALIDQVRQQHGLPAVPRSPVLTAVAEAHVRDLQRHPPQAPCNLHSWSDQGDWTPCCYTPDHAAAGCMWRKPAELSGGRYRGEGFELVAWRSAPITPGQALMLWQRSEGHAAMLLNRGIWQRRAWRAQGVAIAGQHAVAWFSDSPDPG